MKKILRYFTITFLIFGFGFSSVKVSGIFPKTAITKTSDKLLGNFIEYAYNIFYKRESDLDGFSYWYDMLGNGLISVSYFIEKFVLESEEFLKTTRLKDDFVDKVYRFIFDREVDEDNMEYWLKYIDDRIIYHYKKYYPSNYTNDVILTLRWNINDSPEVINDVISKLLESDEISIRVSLMSVKLNDSNSFLSHKRSSASAVYNSLNSNIYEYDDSKEVSEAEKKASDLQKELSKKPELSNLKNKIIRYLGNNINKVAVSFYDITTQESFDINGDMLFKAGSTYKVPLNLVLYDLVQAGKIDLNNTVKYIHEKHYEGGSGILQDHIIDNALPPQKFSELSKMSLLNSDNIAANMLITGISQYANLYGEYGKILGYVLNRTGNVFTTNEMNTFLKKLYYNEKNNPYYNNIANYMKNSSTGVRIGRYIPSNIVASKYGSYQGNYHDIGIVFGNTPFIISVYTRDLENAENVIANIAKLAYEK